MSPESSRILAAMEKRRVRLARWLASQSFEETVAIALRQIVTRVRVAEQIAAGETTDHWYATYRRPDEATQRRHHERGLATGIEGSLFSCAGVLPDES